MKYSVLYITCYERPNDVGNSNIQITIEIQRLTDVFLEYIHHIESFTLNVSLHGRSTSSKIAAHEMSERESTLIPPQLSVGSEQTVGSFTEEFKEKHSRPVSEIGAVESLLYELVIGEENSVPGTQLELEQWTVGID